MKQKTIWKYELPLAQGPEVRIVMPRGAQIIHCGTQPNSPATVGAYVWAIVDPEEPKGERAFAAVMTGQPTFVTCDTHLATLVLNNGTLVVHVFDLGDVPKAKA